ncbi:MAG: hypothetical protein Q8P13_02525 [bacterium]|nr:hypothetical protein [bacterium]
MTEKQLPKIIKEVGFDFSWDEGKVWTLNIPVEEMDIGELSWHFEIPFWGSTNGFYDLKPSEVLAHPEKHKEHLARVETADLTHPLDIMFWKNRWLLLDGLHRLAKLSSLGFKKVKVRKIPQSSIPQIQK